MLILVTKIAAAALPKTIPSIVCMCSVSASAKASVPFGVRWSIIL